VALLRDLFVYGKRQYFDNNSVLTSATYGIRFIKIRKIMFSQG
jgi:hypothetical protein